MRERLIELLEIAHKHCSDCDCSECSLRCERDCEAINIADYLLDNGVIVLPCKVGDTVWEIRGVRWKGYDWKFPVYDNASATETKFNLEMLPRIGKKAFLTKEEAEAKLKELKGE